MKKHARSLVASFLATSCLLGALALSARAEGEFQTAELQPLTDFMSDPTEDPLLARMRKLFETGFNATSSAPANLRTARYGCATRSTRTGDFQLDDSIFVLIDIIPGAYQMMQEDALPAIFQAQQTHAAIGYGRTELVQNAENPNTFDTILIAHGETPISATGERMSQTHLQRTGKAAALGEDMFVIEWMMSEEEQAATLAQNTPTSPETLTLQPKAEEPRVLMIAPYSVPAISNPKEITVGYTFCAAIPEPKKEAVKKPAPKTSQKSAPKPEPKKEKELTPEELEILKNWTN